jgi:hypothetical protein
MRLDKAAKQAIPSSVEGSSHLTNQLLPHITLVTLKEYWITALQCVATNVLR